MGHYQEDYEIASADLVEYYGQPISYLDDSLNDPACVDAQVHPEKAERKQNEYGWYWHQYRTVKFVASNVHDASGNVVEVRSDGVFTITDAGVDREYVIESIRLLPGNRVACELVRASAGEVGRKDYRR